MSVQFPATVSTTCSPSGFRPVWEAYYLEMERVATTLMQTFAVGLGMDKHYFDDKVDRHITNFSVLHIPNSRSRRCQASSAPAPIPTMEA